MRDQCEILNKFMSLRFFFFFFFFFLLLI
ncbi:unknown protein [Parachlamydia acanthamoebae UV-7]|uniref:Uncharacterized protein n=1 Tax=Parachlamydia acanthamoebae (strain UV7) TaxID=765952 RepID=F8KWL8_PARAV|nr:unknown protein [Parachlamydia acanthamoebae UV-7]